MDITEDLELDVRRVQSLTRQELTDTLKTKMLGLSNDTNPSLGFKKSAGDMVWFNAEGGDATYESLKLTGIANGSIQNIGIDADGDVIVVGDVGGGGSVGSDNNVNVSNGAGDFKVSQYNINGDTLTTTDGSDPTQIVQITPKGIKVQGTDEDLDEYSLEINREKIVANTNSFNGTVKFNGAMGWTLDGDSQYLNLETNVDQPTNAVNMDTLSTYCDLYNGVEDWGGITQLVTYGYPTAQISYGTVVINGRRVNFPNTVVTPTWSSDLQVKYSVMYYDTASNTIKTRGTFLDNAEKRTRYILATLFSTTGGSTITGWILDTMRIDTPINFMRDAAQFGRQKSGFTISTTASPYFSLSPGSIFYPSANWHIDPLNPNTYRASGQSQMTFVPANKNNIESSVPIYNINSVVGPGAFCDYYDNGGTPTLMAPNNFQILRVYGTINNALDDGSRNLELIIQRGQAQYPSITSAQDAITTENFVLNSITARMVCLGAIVIKRGTTVTSNVLNVSVRMSDMWGQIGTSGAGAGGSSVVGLRETITYSADAPVFSNQIITPPAGTGDWSLLKTGHPIGNGFKVAKINAQIARFVTNNTTSEVTLELRAVATNGTSSGVISGTSGTVVSSVTITGFPNTVGGEKFYYAQSFTVNNTIPDNSMLFCRVANQSLTAGEGVTVNVILEEV